MAEQDRKREKRPSPCPHCGAVMPGGAKFCGECGKALMTPCENCSRPIPSGQGYKACLHCGHFQGVADLAAAGAAPADRNRCGYCGGTVPAGVAKCPTCFWWTKPFRRLCPGCKKVVELTANSCKHCGKRFPLSVERIKYYLTRVLCRRPNCRRSDELDNWAAARRIPLLFQTERGVKASYFPSPEAAAETWLRYFEATGSRTPPDEAPWVFRNRGAALDFILNFPCRCGATDWRLADEQGLQDAVKNVVVQLAPPTVTFLKRVATSLGKVIAGGRKELPKDKGKKGK